MARRLAGLLALLLALSTCAPRQVRLEGRVVDGETGQALGGATVRLDVAVACRAGGEVRRDPQPRRYVDTDAEGRFAIIGDEVKAACWHPELWGELRVRAPGYLPAQERDVFGTPGPEVSSGVLPLRRAGGRPGLAAGTGRFASVPGAAFHRLAVTREGHLLAEDARAGRLHAWTGAGAAVGLALPEGLELAGTYHRPDRDFPVARLGGRLFVMDDPSRWLELRVAAGALRQAVESQGLLVTLESDGRAVGTYDARAVSRSVRVVGMPAGGVRPLGDVVAGAEGRAECLTALPEPGRRPVLMVAAGGQRRLVALRPAEPRGVPAAWVTLPLGAGALSGEVTACAGGRHALYVATRDGALVKLERPAGRDGDPWEATRRVRIDEPGGPVVFVALAVGDAHLRPEAVHVAGGGETIYRFDEDLIPD